MNDAALHLILRAKGQIRQETSWCSLLLFALAIAAVLRLFGIKLLVLYLSLFVLFLISLVLTLDLLINIGTVSTKKMISLISSQLNSDADALGR